MDLFFLLDGANRMSNEDYQASLNFTTVLASKFNVSDSKVQLGCLLTPVEDFSPLFFESTSNINDFKSSLMTIEKPVIGELNYACVICEMVRFLNRM